MIVMNISAYLQKTFADSRSRANQAGQAIVEYILVLAITVSIILGVLYQFNDAFRSFLDSYFGDYIACLLETGELPALGGQGPNQGQCNARFDNFSLSMGRPLVPSTGTGGASGTSGDSASDATSSDSGGSSNSPGSRLRPSSQSSSGGSSNSESFSNSNNNLRPSTQKYNANENQGDPVGLDSASVSSADSGSRGGGRRVRKRIIYLEDEYLSDDAKKKKDKTVEKGKKSDKDKMMANLRPTRFPLSLPEPQRQRSDIETKGFSLMFFIKFLLIAAILIAIFIFLGGQAMQIKKSWQKSE